MSKKDELFESLFGKRCESPNEWDIAKCVWDGAWRNCLETVRSELKKQGLMVHDDYYADRFCEELE